MFKAPCIDGRYRLMSKLTQGGMASIYRALDLGTGQERAIKILLQNYAESKTLCARFESEAQTMATLSHKHLVRVFDVGRVNRLPFLVMELIEGGDLEHWTRKNRPLSAAEARHLITQVLHGLSHAHQSGVIHRDIKPANILLDGMGGCKLTDFGIAQTSALHLTKTGSAMGTIGYMAPEQRADAKNVDLRADVFSVGATLFRLVTGVEEVDLYLAEHEPDLIALVPEPLRPIIVKACAHAPERRYANTMEMADALAHLSLHDDEFSGVGPLGQAPKDKPLDPEKMPELRLLEQTKDDTDEVPQNWAAGVGSFQREPTEEGAPTDAGLYERAYPSRNKPLATKITQTGAQPESAKRAKANRDYISLIGNIVGGLGATVGLTAALAVGHAVWVDRASTSNTQEVVTFIRKNHQTLMTHLDSFQISNIEVNAKNDIYQKAEPGDVDAALALAASMERAAKSLPKGALKPDGLLTELVELNDHATSARAQRKWAKGLPHHQLAQRMGLVE